MERNRESRDRKEPRDPSSGTGFKRMYGPALERLTGSYDLSTLDPDPLLVVREFADRRDQEFAAFFAAVFAYGNAKVIVRNTRDLFARMPGGPWAFVARCDAKTRLARLSGWRHRLHTGEDAALLASALARTVAEDGSLEESFLACLRPSDGDVGRALSAFVGRLRERVPAGETRGRFFAHLLPSPKDGSACKRLNLFLRWVVRDKSPDLGLWQSVPPSLLVLPLDTHVARICRKIGLSARTTADWKMAAEITRKFRVLDPSDPVRFDYAIARLGILGDCPPEPASGCCTGCSLSDLCRDART